MTGPEYVPGHALLAGKTVLVTAAAGTGIGSAVAQRCVEEGARVVVSDKHERRLGETAERLGVPGIPCDVTDEESVQALFAARRAELGAIDVLVNNAGLGGTRRAARDDRRAVVTSCSTSRSTAPSAARAPRSTTCTRTASGVIVNNASVLGWRAQAGQAHYAAAKAGVMALTRCAAIEAGAARRARQRGRAEHRHARQPRQGHHRRAARRAADARGVRPRAPSRGRSPT